MIDKKRLIEQGGLLESVTIHGLRKKEEGIAVVSEKKKFLKMENYLSTAVRPIQASPSNIPEQQYRL